MKHKTIWGIRLLSLMLIVCLFLTSAVSAEKLTPSLIFDKVIRVSCPIQPGFFEVDENGNYSGYSYEFLMKIAQRTGWRYEFETYEPANENLVGAMEKLKSGKVDLIPSMVYSSQAAEDFEFTSVPYGASNFILVTGEDNEKVNERTFFDLPELRVAMDKSATVSNTAFNTYVEQQKLNYTAVYTTGDKSAKDLVLSGEADVFITKDIIKNEGFKPVVSFEPQPFYFAATKGNTQLTEELSRIIQEINTSTPYYARQLSEKYFSFASNHQLALTQDEQDYLESVQTVRMVILAGRAPISDYDPQTEEFSGIIVDVVRKMSADSGLNIEFVPAGSVKEASLLMQEGKADAFAGFPYDYDSAEKYGVLLTSPVFNMPIVRITNITGEAENDGILVSSSIKLFENDDNVRFVDNLDEIFRLVNSGEYKDAYVNGYLAQHLLEDASFTNVFLTQTPYSNYEICIGVYRNTDLHLVSILDQMISGIKSGDVEDIVYQNTIHSRSMSLFEFIKRNPLEFFLIAFLIFFIILALLLVLFFKTRRLNKIISREKSKYQKISALDRLSQTYNNEAFKQLSRSYLSQTDIAPYGAFLVCDIDNFKSVNDTYGHLMGDQVIHAMGELLRDTFRERDLVGRLGGDEFVMLMKKVSDRDVIAKRCENLLNGCAKLIEQGEITLSIGVAVFKGNVSFDELFKAADSALYQVKNNGKNGFNILDKTITRS